MEESTVQIGTPVSFRKLVPSIRSTTYGMFGLYRYPAKFIPQVVSYIIEKYGKQGMWVLDPFAGSGTTGLVARSFGLNYEMWDLNPLLKILHDVAILPPVEMDVKQIIHSMAENNSFEWLPKWRNINYWYPEDLIPFLGKIWGFYHNLADQTTKKNYYSSPLKNNPAVFI